MRLRHLLGALSIGLAVMLGWSACARAQSTPVAAPADGGQTDEDAAWSALRAGAIVVFRHALAPGVGDPPGMQLRDCTSQRNLDAEGRAQARRIGERLRQQQVTVGAVWSSQWCRTRETAELMAAGPVREQPAFNSFFGERSRVAAQTAAARELLLGWRGTGALVVVTHQVNISAFTGDAAASGQGVVLRAVGDQLVSVGRVLP